MTDVYFYHLERSEPRNVLPSLLEKTLQRGWRALVKAPTSEELEALDDALWTYRDDSFLPHGTDDPAHPVLLSLASDPANGAEAAFLAPGATMTPDEMRQFERCVLLFMPDGAEAARAQWRILKEEGFAVTYWKQTLEGRWEQAGV
ncbi:MAG: DNA polymerase III subunit chi [Pseudomonadota bacterium]